MAETDSRSPANVAEEILADRAKQSNENRKLLKELAIRGKARSSLIGFAKYLDPTYEVYKPHEYIAERLEKVLTGEIRRLAIFIPPASGKSTLVSRTFPAYALAKDPTLKFIATSYNADLAKGFGREVRNKIREPAFQTLFPRTQIAEDATAADQWATTAGGTYKAEGVGGGLIGFHAHIAIIDDPLRSWADALAPNTREASWDWYTSVLLNRLRPYKDGKGAVILIMQRWHDLDLGGRVINDPEWEVVSLPSLAEEDDPLGREPGEALIPEWRTREELLDLQKKNPTQFLALHQQKPVADEGDIFNLSWFQRYDTLPDNLVYYGASDYAVSESGGDFTVHLVAGMAPNKHLYIVDLWRERTTSRDWVEAYIEMIRRYEPFMWADEKGQIIKGVAPWRSLRMREEGLSVIQKPFTSTTNKVLRARAIAAMAQEGRISLPRQAPWVGDFEFELSRFPRGQHDDMVDAFSLLGRMIEKLRPDFAAAAALEKPKPEQPRSMTFKEALKRRGDQRAGKRVRRRVTYVAAGSPPHDHTEANVA